MSGERRQKRRTSFLSNEAKRIARELEDEYLEGGEMALYSDDLTFEDLANHCQQTKCCEAEYDESWNKLFGVRDTSVYEAHLKHFKEYFGKIRVRISGWGTCAPIETIGCVARRKVAATLTWEL